MFLRPDVHAVRIGEDLVFLDVAADRYLCWPHATELALSADRRVLSCADVAPFGDLQEAGLFAEEAAAVGDPWTPLAPPQRDLLEPARSSLRAADRLQMVRATADAMVIYPRCAFRDLVAFAGARPAGAAPDRGPSDGLAELTARFHQWAVWIPAPSKCLIRSFVLLRLLRRRGFHARWVFAVRTWPFAAHCWLQAGDVVLDDAVERLVSYHPILVI